MIMQRIMALLMLLVWYSIQQQSASVSQSIIESYFTVLPWNFFLLSMAGCSLLLIILPHPKFWFYSALTGPLVLYIGYYGEAALALHLSFVPFAIGALLYLILLVSIWGYE